MSTLNGIYCPYYGGEVNEPMASRLVEHVAKCIREFRTSYGGGSGISQEALAKALGVAPNTISRWETATHRPSLEELEKLARFFGRAVRDFIPDPDLGSDTDVKQNERIGALVRTVKQLPADDVELLREWAEVRRSHRVYGRMPPGRKPKK
jgi:transcriptional regulator with XRE-family HTH domain